MVEADNRSLLNLNMDTVTDLKISSHGLYLCLVVLPWPVIWMKEQSEDGRPVRPNEVGTGLCIDRHDQRRG